MKNNIFNRKEKVLFGVCSHIAIKYNFNPMILRIIFIINGILIAGPVILLYFILAVYFGKVKLTKKIIFSIIGAIIGIPLSYYFQPEMIKMKTGGIAGYLKSYNMIGNNSNLLSNVVISIIVFTLLGLLIGYFIDKNEEHNNS